MPVLDAVQTFAGIANENEFYSHHYLAEVFKGDIKARLDAWDAAEEPNIPATKPYRAPYKRLQAWAQQLVQPARPDPACARRRRALAVFTADPVRPTAALGYAAPPGCRRHELVAGSAGADLACCNCPQLAHHCRPTSRAPRTKTCSTSKLRACTMAASRCPAAAGRNLGGHAVGRVFGAENAPRYRAVWWASTSGCCSTATSGPTTARCASTGPKSSTARTRDTLKAAAALLHRDSLAPAEGASLLEAWTKTPTSTPSASART